MLDCNKSLHIQQGELKQLGHIQKHCNQWIENFDQLLQVTKNAAPVRKPRQATGRYELQRKSNTIIDKTQQERRLEQALWLQWDWKRYDQTGRWFIDHVCKYILTYQMPLQDKRDDRGWGKVDIVGVSKGNLPVVLELKKEVGDCLLWAMAEALGYAIAVKKTWADTAKTVDRGLRSEWAAAIDDPEAEQMLPKSLSSIPIVIIAPYAYWQRCMGQPGRRKQPGRITPSAWPSLNRLADCFNSRGYPISFVTFDLKYPSQGLPWILDPRHADLPR